MPVALRTNVDLRPKFTAVEMQLPLKIMKYDEQMHRNYAVIRDKMTN